MRKRLKKKLTNKYNVLNGAKRQRYKRKGVKCISYAFLPIGERDKAALSNDEMIPDYSFASHWLIEAYAWEECSQVRVFPCSKKGGTTSSSPLHIIVLEGKKGKEVSTEFNKACKDMKNDRFWEINS
ncbi:hypothetical protein [Planococcus salinarum]|uniref:hypothetical protein n=1 Tax=Planococcus salinarum TaxID=622695 RepID=UPI000E3DD220|nr:hypothetical protein [Planococcus salinarum]TAA72564.1 hypothetical protein D2909_05180 [Planococcus salinarum]